MSSRFASLHSGLLIRDRAPAPPPLAPPLSAVMTAPQPTPQPEPSRTAVIRPFPFPPAVAPAPQPQAPAAAQPVEASPRRRSFTLRLDEKQHLLLQIAKRRFGLSGQRLLLRALEALLGKGG